VITRVRARLRVGLRVRVRVRVSRTAVDHVAEVVDLRPVGLLLGYPLPRGLAHVEVGLEGRRQLHGHELILVRVRVRVS